MVVVVVVVVVVVCLFAVKYILQKSFISKNKTNTSTNTNRKHILVFRKWFYAGLITSWLDVKARIKAVVVAAVRPVEFAVN